MKNYIFLIFIVLPCICQFFGKYHISVTSQLKTHFRFRNKTNDGSFSAGTGLTVNASESLQCIQCNSEYDSNCKNSSVKTDYCTSPFNMCYFTVINGNVRRGCVGDALFENYDQCHESKTCSICSHKNLCNEEPLKYTFTCHSHLPKSNKSEPEVIECPITFQKLGCYARKIENSNSVSRGCVAHLSEDEQELCQKNGPDCKVCEDHNCNKLSYFLKCVTCDSSIDSGCVNVAANATVEQCDDPWDQCFIHVADNRVQRGCLKQSKSKVKEDCSSNESKCETCRNEKICNAKPIQNTCIKCENEYACLHKPQSYASTPCSLDDPFSSEENGCYLHITAKDADQPTSAVKRGCVKDLLATGLDECRGVPDKCQICLGKDCNQKRDIHPDCLSCNGKNGDNCAIEATNAIKCANYNESCFTGIDSEGYTVRGCSGEKPETALNLTQANVCYHDSCNWELFPGNRRTCYQCDGDSNCTFNDHFDRVKPQVCEIYTKDDKCVMFVYEGESS